MMKKDGKEIYTFNGLINRMEACMLRTNRLTERDIPEEVEFKNRIYKLDGEKKFYYDPGTGVTLAEIVGEQYGMDMFKFLTKHDFIVTPKKKIFLTSEEKEFLRMCNLFMGHDNATMYKIMRKREWQCKDYMLLGLFFHSDPNIVAYEEWVSIAPTTFLGLEDRKIYSLKDLNVYE